MTDPETGQPVHGVFVDGDRVKVPDDVRLHLGALPAFEPPLPVPLGAEVRVYLRGELQAIMVERDGVAVSPLVGMRRADL